jgi:hypothetical protein
MRLRGQNPHDFTTVKFQFFSGKLGTSKYNCGQEIGPVVIALQVDELARPTEADVTELRAMKFVCFSD